MKFGKWDVDDASLTMWKSETEEPTTIPVAKNYGVWGEKADDFAFIINNTPVAYSMTGGVKGLYYAEAEDFLGTVDVVGDLSAKVAYDAVTGNFQINDFSITSTSAGHPHIIITGASGPFTDGNFEITSATHRFGSENADIATARGSIYGPAAEAMGGVWAIEKLKSGAVLQGAYGYFHGSR